MGGRKRILPTQNTETPMTFVRKPDSLNWDRKGLLLSHVRFEGSGFRDWGLGVRFATSGFT